MDNELNLRLNLFANNRTQNAIADVQQEISSLNKLIQEFNSQTIRSFNTATNESKELAPVFAGLGLISKNLTKDKEKAKESFQPLLPLLQMFQKRTDKTKQSVSQLNQMIVSTASSVLGLNNPIGSLDRILSGGEGGLLGKASDSFFTGFQSQIKSSIEEIGGLDKALKGAGRTLLTFSSSDESNFQSSRKILSGIEGINFFSGSLGAWAPLLSLNSIIGSTSTFLHEFNTNITDAGKNLSEYATNALPKLIDVEERLAKMPDPIGRMNPERTNRRLGTTGRLQVGMQKNLLSGIQVLGDDIDTRQTVVSTVANEAFNQTITPVLRKTMLPALGNFMRNRIDSISNVVSTLLTTETADPKYYEHFNKISRNRIGSGIERMAPAIAKQVGEVLYSGVSVGLDPLIIELSNFLPSSILWQQMSGLVGSAIPMLGKALSIGAAGGPLDDLFYNIYKKIPVLGSLGGNLVKKLGVSKVLGGTAQWFASGEGTNLKKAIDPNSNEPADPLPFFKGQQGGVGALTTSLSEKVIAKGVKSAVDVVPEPIKNLYKATRDKIPQEIENIETKLFDIAYDRISGFFDRKNWLNFADNLQKVTFRPVRNLRERIERLIKVSKESFFGNLPEILGGTITKILPTQVGIAWGWMRNLFPQAGELQATVSSFANKASQTLGRMVGVTADKNKKYIAKSLAFDVLADIVSNPMEFIGLQLENFLKVVPDSIKAFFSKLRAIFPNLSSGLEESILKFVDNKLKLVRFVANFLRERVGFLTKLTENARTGIGRLIENTLKSQYERELGAIKKTTNNQQPKELLEQAEQARKEAIKFDKLARAERIKAYKTEKRTTEDVAIQIFETLKGSLKKDMAMPGNMSGVAQALSALSPTSANVVQQQLDQLPELTKKEVLDQLPSLWKSIPDAIKTSLVGSAPDDLSKQMLQEIFDKSFAVFDSFADQVPKPDKEIIASTLLPALQGLLKDALLATFDFNKSDEAFQRSANYERKAEKEREKATLLEEEAGRVAATPDQKRAARDEFQRIKEQRKVDKARVAELEKRKQEIQKLPTFSEEDARAEEARLQKLTGSFSKVISSDERALIVTQLNEEILQITSRYQNAIEQMQAKAKLMFKGEGISTDESSSKLFKEIDRIFGGGLTKLTNQLGKDAATGLFRGLIVGTIDNISNSVGKIDRIAMRITESFKTIPARFIEPLTASKKLFAGLAMETTGLKMLQTFRDGFEQFSGKLFMATQQIAIFQSTFQGVAGLAQNNPLMTMIRQADEFQQQLITLQSSIASTNQIKLEGQVIANPTNSIKILEKPIQSAVERLREGSLQLSGITSQELIDPFIIVSGQVGQLGMNLTQATDLTLSFASAVTSLKLPANQFAQEIRSIVTGQITSDSMVAKTLGITNQMVGRWRSQGKVFDELSKRLEVFRAGQSLTAKTLGGLQSNIAEVFQEAGRIAGGKLLGPLTENLQGFYDYIFGNKDAINEYLSGLMNIVLEIGKAFKEAGIAIFSSAAEIGAQLPEVALQTAADAAKVFSQAIVDATKTLSPFISVLAVAAQTTLSLSSPFLSLAIQFKVFETAAKALFLSFGGIMQAMPIVGGLMTALSVRGLPMINVFANLYDKVGLGAAGFLVLGKNMKAIPGMADTITKALGAKFGPFASILTGIIPIMSTIGIQAAGLAKVVPFMATGLTGILRLAPSAITGIGAQLAALPIFAGNNKVVTSFFGELAKSVQDYTGVANISTEVSKLFTRTIADIGTQFKIFVLQTAAIGAGFLLVATAIDQLILKNQAALDVLKVTFGVLLDIPRIIIQETIPAIAQIPNILGIIGAGIGTVVAGMLALKASSVGLAASLAGVAAVGQLAFLGAGATAAAGALGFMIGKLMLIKNAIVSITTATQALIITGLVPFASQIGIVGDALTQMAAKSTAATAALTSNAAAAQSAAIGNFKLNGTFLMTTAQATALGPALSGLSVALTGFAAGTGSATAVWSAFMAALKLALIPLASFAVLISGVFVAAIAVAAIRMNQLQKEMADWNEQTNTMLDTSAKIERVMIRNAKEQEKRSKYGIALTKEEYQKNKQIQELALKDVQAMQQQIADLNKSRDKSKLNKAEIDGQVQLLEQQIKRLQDRAQNIQISTKPLQELGGTLTQLAEKSALALEGITNAAGDPEIFKQAADTLIKITQQELELGAISEKVATERLSTLVNNTKLEVDLRVAAEQALQKVRESATQKRIEEEKKAQQQIQTLADQGKMSEAKAAQELATARLKEIEVQINAERQAHEERMKMRRAELAYEWEKLNVQAEAKERTLKYDTATDSTEAKSDLQKQQAKIADVQKQLAAGAAQIEAIQGKGGAASAEEQNQLQLLKAQQKTLEGQMTSYTDLIKYLESTIARLDLKKEAPAKIQEIAESLKQTSDSIQELEARLAATSNKGQQAEIQSQIASAKERQSGLLAEQNKYQTASQEMSAEAKDNLQKDLTRLKSEQKAIEQSGNAALKEEQRKHGNKLAELEAERAKVEKEKRDREKQERLKDFDEQLKISEAQRATGLKDEQQAAIDAQKINEGKVREEMKQLENRKKKLEEEAKKAGKSLKEFDKEAAEEIEAQEAEHQQKLTEIRKQAFQRRMSDLKEDLSEQQAVIEAAQETGKIDNQQAAKQGVEATRKNAQKQLKLIEEQLKQLKKTDIEGREELLKQKAEIEKQVAQAEKKAAKDRLADSEQDTDERLAKIELSEKKGADRQVTIQESLVEKTKGINEQLAIIQEAKKTARGEYLEELIAQEQKLQGKLIDAQQEALDKQIADLKEDSDERIAIIEKKESEGVDKQVIIRESLIEKEKSINGQLLLIRKQMATASGEVLEKLKAQEAKLVKELNDARKQALDQQLADIKQDSEERLAEIERRESDGADKQIIIQETLVEKQKELGQRLAVIRKAMATARGEELERLKAEEQKTLKELNNIRKEAFEQSLADIKEDSEERLATIERKESEGVDKQVIIRETLVEKETELKERLARIRQEMVGATGENYERLKKLEQQAIKELNNARREALDQQLSDIKEDSEERLASIERSEAEGADKQTTIQAARVEKEKEINQRLKVIREQMKTATGENYERLKAMEQKALKELQDIRKQAFDQQLADIKEDSEERLAQIEYDESNGVDKQATIQATRVEKEQEVTQRLAVIREAMLTATGENYERLAAQEKRALKELNDIRRQAFEQQLADIKEDSDERMALIELLESKGSDKGVTIGKRLAEQERQLTDSLRLIRQEMGSASGENLERLKAQEARLMRDLNEARKQANEQRLSDLKEDSEEQNTILESQFIAGMTSEEEYYKKRLANTLKFLDAQLQLIKAAQSQLGQGQTEEQERLAAQESQIMKAREAALSEYQDSQLSLLERQQRETSQIIELSEIERQKQTQQAINDGLMTQTEADAAKLESTRERITSELELEQQKLSFLQSQPAFSDPRKEEERQSKIRESQKKTAQLQLQLIEQERQAQEALFKAISDEIDRQVAKLQNTATAVQQRLELEIKQQDYLGKALENQNRLLQARQALQGALSQFIDTEFKIMEATATTEKERNRVAKLQADYKMQSLRFERQTQREMLEIDIKRSEIAQERAETENQIAQVRAAADLAKTQAEVAKVNADPKATEEQKEAASLAVEAAMMGLAGTIAEGQSLQQQRQITDQENAMKRQTQAIQQQSQLRAAELERIQGIKNEGRRKLELKALSGAITPAEMESLNRLREREKERQAWNQPGLQQSFVGGLTSEKVISIAKNQQTSLQDSALMPEQPAINMGGIIQNLTSELSANVAGAVNQSNNILGSIAGQLGNIIGIIKDTGGKPSANTPQGPITVNNITAGPSPQQIQQISQQTTLKTLKGVFSLL